MLIMPSGYSVGAGWLLLGSFFLLVRRPALELTFRDIWFVSAFIFYALIHISEAWWDGQGISGVDTPLRFLLAIPSCCSLRPTRHAYPGCGVGLQ
ncbi:hypothetical protein [Vreelandella azerica]|uniref:hypothetical protein n=1 Tax=Vreelandella azerica TaxID=2732867 RepID=UPI001F186D69|nr:hypothetical protein [Halomonas azerica]